MKRPYNITGLKDRIEEVMEEKHLKRSDIINGAGITATKLSNILTGESFNLGADTIMKLCKYLKVSADWLLGLSDFRSPEKNVQDACRTLELSEDAVRSIIRLNTVSGVLDGLEEILTMPEDQLVGMMVAIMNYQSQVELLKKPMILEDEKLSDDVKDFISKHAPQLLLLNHYQAADYYATKAGRKLVDGLMIVATQKKYEPFKKGEK